MSHSTVLPKLLRQIFALVFVATLPAHAFGQLEIFRPGAGRQGNEKTIKEAKEAFMGEFPLTITKGRIGFEFPAHKDAAVASASTIVGGMNTSASTGNNGFSYEARGSLLAITIGNLSRGMRIGVDSDSRELVSLRGVGPDDWNTQFINKDDYFLCSHLDLKAKLAFQLVDHSTGVRMILFDGPKMVSLQAPSFRELAEQPEFRSVVKQAESWGIRFPSSANSLALNEMLVGVFQVSSDDWDNFQNDFSNLVSGTFKEREESTERLIKELNQWKHLVAWGLTSETTSTEMKSRLLTAVKAGGSDEGAEGISQFIAEKLMDNPMKLVELLVHQSSLKSDARTRIIARLERLTQQEFGSDVTQWQRWAETQSQLTASDEPAQPASRRQFQTSPDQDPDSRNAEQEETTRSIALDLVREEVSTLLTLGIDDQNRIRLDRQGWAACFGSKSIAQVFKDIQDQYQESGLPASWLNLGGGHDLATIDYPQLLFARIEEALNSKMTGIENQQMIMMQNLNRMNNARMRMMHANRSLNRELNFGQIEFRIQLHPELKQGGVEAEIPKPQFFRFRFNDTEKNQHVWIDEYPSGDFNLLISNINTGEFVTIHQSAEGQNWIHISTSSDSFSANEPNPHDLFNKHADELQRKLHPILSRHGIDLAKSIGGALSIKNATYQAPRNRFRDR
jgi:hypothetical protein